MTHTYKAQHSGGTERRIKKFKFNLGYSQKSEASLGNIMGPCLKFFFFLKKKTVEN